jgi:hypothetical protein
VVTRVAVYPIEAADDCVEVVGVVRLGGHDREAA